MNGNEPRHDREIAAKRDRIGPTLLSLSCIILLQQRGPLHRIMLS
jgi:hypothetical protein